LPDARGWRWLRSLLMAEQNDLPRDLGALVVPLTGALIETGDPWEPYRLVDPAGCRVAAVADFLRELQAAGRPAATQRSYGMALLRWFRFLWAVQVPWDQATRVEARDFSRWIRLAGKPDRPHWRPASGQAQTPAAAAARRAGPLAGKQPAGRKYASATVAHCETVLRSFYSCHLEAGSGPLVNPFPLARAGRANAHHNPMDLFGRQRSGVFRPRQARRFPRQIPDQLFNELFAGLSSHRDRALVAFWVSTGARASELLGVLCSGADPGQQLITVVRKGSRALQQLPASPDAFVWLRLYQQMMHGLAPAGPDDPLWWTLRRPFRPLGYHAARAMFVRANAILGTSWSLHDLRHTAAYRLARDPQMPITDVQWVLGHASLSTTQLYVTPAAEDVIASTLAHHRRQAGPKPAPSAGAGLGYRAESLDVLFGREQQ